MGISEAHFHRSASRKRDYRRHSCKTIKRIALWYRYLVSNIRDFPAWWLQGLPPATYPSWPTWPTAYRQKSARRQVYNRAELNYPLSYSHGGKKWPAPVRFRGNCHQLRMSFIASSGSDALIVGHLINSINPPRAVSSTCTVRKRAFFAFFVETSTGMYG